jgi:transposase
VTWSERVRLRSKTRSAPSIGSGSTYCAMASVRVVECARGLRRGGSGFASSSFRMPSRTRRWSSSFWSQRVERLDGAIDRAVSSAPEHLRAIVTALQALRGVAQETAVTVALEFGSFTRFERATQAMGYTGLVASEYSSGTRKQQGAITKTGNSHLRRALVEAAWHYRHRPRLNQRQKELQRELSPKVAELAWKAQERLYRRYWALTNKSKPSPKVVTALARELVGFVWAIGKETEQAAAAKRAA